MRRSKEEINQKKPPFNLLWLILFRRNGSLKFVLSKQRSHLQDNGGLFLLLVLSLPSLALNFIYTFVHSLYLVICPLSYDISDSENTSFHFFFPFKRKTKQTAKPEYRGEHSSESCRDSGVLIKLHLKLNLPLCYFFFWKVLFIVWGSLSGFSMTCSQNHSNR